MESAVAKQGLQGDALYDGESAMSGSGSAPVTTQVSNSQPWSGAQPGLTALYQTAQNMYAGGGQFGYNPYTGPTVAGLDPTMNQALQTQLGMANIAQGQLSDPNNPLNLAYNNAANVIANSGLS